MKTTVTAACLVDLVKKSTQYTDDLTIKYIPYSALETIFLTVRDNRISYLNNQLDDYKKLSECLLDIFSNIKVDNNFDRIKTAQKMYNGIGVVEDAIFNTYGDYFSFGSDVEFDHFCLHTGQGFSGTDFILKKDFNIIKVADTGGLCTEELKSGTKIDAKSYLTSEGMLEAINANKNGKLGHFGHYIFAYVIKQKRWYIIDNFSNKTSQLFNFNPVFRRNMLRLKLDDKGLLVVSDF